MERNNISTFKRMLLVISITGTFLYANIIPAHKAKKISYSSTQKVIKEFMSNKKTLSAYKEVEKYADKRIRETANGGFYNIVRIKIDDINTKTKNMKFNKLSKKQKDILKYILKNKLQKLGYKIEKGQYDILGLDWWVTWEK